MSSAAGRPLQQELLPPEALPPQPARPASGAGGSPPRPPPRVVVPASGAAPSLPREWWAALQLEQASASALHEAALRAQGFTPRVSLAPPDAVLLELRGSLRLFGGLEGLRESLQSAFPAPCRLAFAPTPLAALVFARAGVPACLTDVSRLAGELAPLPLGVLRWPEDAVRRLDAIGVRSLGALLRLPRAGFARRFGALALQSLDQLLGRQGDPRPGFAAAERFRRRCDPDTELADQAAVLAVLAPLLAELERFLRQRQRGITSLALQLVHREHAPTRHVLRFAAPATQAAQCLRLLELQLQRTGLPAPVRRCELRSGPLVEPAATSGGLWHPGQHGGGVATTQMPSFLEQLRVRLGDAAVTSLGLAEDHRPERLSVSTEPALPAARQGAAGASKAAQPSHGSQPAPPWSAGRRPLWLLETPEPLAEQGAWPCRQGQRLTLLAGPERVETGWWDGGEIERDYYHAADARGARLWIYRERKARQGWFLHGFFG